MNMPPCRNVFRTFEPGQWRPVSEAAPGNLVAQVICRTITAGKETGWARCQVWRYLPDEPGPELVVVEVLVELLPEDARPVTGKGPNDDPD